MKANEYEMLDTLKSRKFLIPLICFLTVVAGLFFIVSTWNVNRIKELDTSYCIKDSASNYQYSIDEFYYEDTSIYLKDNIVHMSGWFTKVKANIDEVSIKVVFQDMQTEKYYIMPTLMSQREDVISFVNGEYNHRYSGFSMDVEYKRLNKDTDYKIFILYDLNGKYYLVDMNSTLKTSGYRYG